MKPKPIKWLLRSAIAIAVLAVLLSIALKVVLDTSAGTRWAIARANAALPGDIAATDFDGTLWRGLKFPQFRYSDADRELEATDFSFEIRWSHLTVGSLTLDKIAADTIQYRSLAPPPPSPTPFELSMPAVPIDIVVIAVDVRRINWIQRGQSYEIQQASIRNAGIDGQTIRVATLSAMYADVAATVEDVKLTLAGDVPTEATLSWQMQDGDWSGNGAVSGSLAAISFDHSVDGPYPATASGIAQVLNRLEPEVEADIAWQSWSFDATTLHDGMLQVRGTKDDYAAEYDAKVTLADNKQFHVAGTARGDTERLRRFMANVDSPHANAALSGTLEWTPAFSAQVQVDAQDINPAAFVAQVSAALDAQALVTIDGDGSVSVANLLVTGLINGQATHASGDVRWAPEQLQCTACDVRVGQNRLQVDSDTLTGDLALSVLLDAPALEEVWPGLSGAIKLDGTLGGSFTMPRFSGELSAQQLHFNEWYVENAQAHSRESDLKVFDVSTSLQSIRRGEAELGSLQLSGKGEMERISIDLDWSFQELVVVASGVVRNASEDLEGTIASAKVSEPHSGDWHLTNPFDFHLSNEQDVAVEPHSWSGDNGRIQIRKFAAAADQIQIAATIDELPLQVANPWLPEHVQIAGSANADVDVTQSAGHWTGSINWQQAGTVIKVTEADNQITDVIIPRAEINAQLRDGGMVAAAAVSIDPELSALLDVELAVLTRNTPVRARLQVHGDQWDWISALIPQVETFKGRINADVTAEGPLNSPEFAGNISWRDGQLLVPALNVPLSAIELVIEGASAGTATLTGSASAGAGTLSVDGQFENLMRATRSVRISLTGDTAELINWPEYRLWATPDLVVEGNADGWTFSGEVDVPRADIVLPELPVEAVTVSPDVSVLGEEEPVAQATRISGEAGLSLGKKVHISALGLDSSLRGDLQLRLPVDKAPNARGRITLVDGVFTAYGQKLTIREGNLTFTGPLDNPLVDVRAVRVIDTFEGTVTAGIHLRGRAQNLTSTVFSEPAMADADALSYLVIGRPLNQATQSEGGELSGAAVALGLRQATRLTQQIGQTIGLDQLSLSGDGGDTTALVAGKQINSRLYTRYAYGVFSRLGTLLLSYKLSRSVTLEAGAGENQSIDLLYSIEKP